MYTNAIIHSGDFISIRECVEDAVRLKVNLTGDSLTEADLTGADLTETNLTGANLTEADLTGANLASVRLWGTRGNSAEIKSLHIFEEYDIAYTDTILQIGCENHPISDWATFDDDVIDRMDEGTSLKFWKDNKDLIFSIIEKCPATNTKRK